jgi:hypothetical protein
MSFFYETRITIAGDIRNVIPATRELGGEISRGKGEVELSYWCDEEQFVEFAKKHNVTLTVDEICDDADTTETFTVTPQGVQREEELEEA